MLCHFIIYIIINKKVFFLWIFFLGCETEGVFFLSSDSRSTNGSKPSTQIVKLSLWFLMTLCWEVRGLRAKNECIMSKDYTFVHSGIEASPCEDISICYPVNHL